MEHSAEMQLKTGWRVLGFLAASLGPGWGSAKWFYEETDFSDQVL